jgi:spore maturation protein CgeB
MKFYPHGFDFLKPYCEESGMLADSPSEAGCILTMNNAGHYEVVEQARQIANDAGLPLCFWTIEDPNSCLYFLPQARLSDYVFTSDACLIDWYREQLKHDRVYWLPLAASPKYHHPLPLADDATDFVFSGNWYVRNGNTARAWGDETVILPLARAGYSMTIYSYDEPPYDELKPFWKGDGGGCRNTAEQYTHGRIVLGNNNQRSGFDGIEKTVMTSMRTFEALACGKLFLTPQSDAYEALGFNNGGAIWSSKAIEWTLHWAKYLLGTNSSGRTGNYGTVAGAQIDRLFVLANHTYTHRLLRIASALSGTADPFDYRASKLTAFADITDQPEIVHADD